MARSLGLATYRAFTRRGDAQTDPPPDARPKGELVWINAAEPENRLAVIDFTQRLCAARPGVSVLITWPEDITPPNEPQRSGIIHAMLPNEHPASTRSFLTHWQPDLCIWTWGILRPNLILETVAQRCPLFLIDADASGFDGRRDRWLPDVTRQMLSHFKVILARSEGAIKRLSALGVPRQDIRLTSGLMAGGQALTCSETDLTELGSALGGRPAWFAAQVLPQEVPVVLAAHHQALRLSHRLLLILNPAAPSQMADILNLAQERNLTTALWDDGQMPDDTTQILVSEDSAEQGLFFRVAPVSFLGSTLFEAGGGCDPFDAAALGSAILYGPRVRRFMPSYTRLAAAGAARIVNDADALGNAVSRLIAPDQAATMAHAGWDIISQGAALVDQVIELAQNTLDEKVVG